MSALIRAVIAEDSLTSLELLVHMLESDDGIHVVGRARNGVEAVRLTKSMHPDIVVMDIHMPVLDGFEATRQIMIETPTPIVIVSAAVDVRAVDVSLHALRLGALTVMPKPTGPDAPEFAEECARFTRTVRSMSAVKVVRRWAPASNLPPIAYDRPAQKIAPAQIIAIAASTGGPTALLRLLAGLPAALPAPILVVQHMAPGFVAGLASWLDQSSALGVKVAQPGERLANGTVYLAPDDHHLGVHDRRTLQVSASAPRGGFRPSGTFLFESVARVYGAGAVGVILTGMGDDGCAGLVALRQAGGRIIAQDEATCVVFGMPAAAIAAGLVHLTLPLELISPRLCAWVPESPAKARQKGTES